MTEQLVHKAAHIFDGLRSCGSNSCLIKAPDGVGTNNTCRCHQKSTVMLMVISRAASVVREAKNVEQMQKADR